MTIGLIDTGCANLASVRFALERGELAYRVIASPQEMTGCDRFILPGVGAAGPAMTRLRVTGWDAALKGDRRPVLGICLGMQILFERSAEGGVECLGLIPGGIEKLPAPEGAVWPHMGWNALEGMRPDEPLLAGIVEGDHVYFVHGFYAPPGPSTAAICEYGRPLTAMVRHGHIVGCQFHPERSGSVGARILANFASSSA